MKKITILIPTYNRPTALAATLTSLIAQTYKDFDVIISDQSSTSVLKNLTIQTVIRILKTHKNNVIYLKHQLRNGMAEHRQFLLDQSQTSYSLFLDDDIILEPYVVDMLLKTIQEQQCGFVGNPISGLSFWNDIRPKEHDIEFWDTKVIPEKITPHSSKWKRHQLHNAANPYLITQKYGITSKSPRIYKVAWVGGCVMYDTKKLQAVGGFSFWKHLPSEHVGEDVLAQLRVMETYGGCGVLPSGAYHQELPTTIKKRNIDAPKILPL